MDDRSTCESIDEANLVIKLNEDWRKNLDAEAHKDSDEILSEDDGNSSPLLRFTKKKRRLTANEKSFRKRPMKRHRFSSPFSSDLKTETDDESDYSQYTPSKAHDVLKFSSASAHPISLEKGLSENGKTEVGGERGRMTVIYEQQSWEGEIIDERDTKQGRGRPRKQYLVRWKPSWVDGGRLTAPGLMQNWRAKKAEKDEH